MRKWVSAFSLTYLEVAVVKALASTVPSGIIMFRSLHRCSHLGQDLSQLSASSSVDGWTGV